jgi:hypothetical protein
MTVLKLIEQSAGNLMEDIFVGCAAGGSGDRTDAASPIVASLISSGKKGVLVFENLAERTLALAQLAKKANPEAGFEPLLQSELRPVLADCLRHNIVIVSNFGAANPHGAAKEIIRMSVELGLDKPKIAVIGGDDLNSEYGRSVLGPLIPSQYGDRDFVSANVYQGAFEIAEAIQAGAQIVVTGRVADPSLVLGPAIAHFGWRRDDWDRLAGATMAGHLLECGAQVTGGYFADPGRKDVPDLAHVGYPIAEISNDGSCIISKPEGTGGLVDIRTAKEQLLYEVHDPAAYLTPDVIADVTEAELTQVGPNRVRLTGVRGHPRPATLKALVYYDGGWLGEAEISYAGQNAEARALLAQQIVRERLGPDFDLRFDLIGKLSVHGDDAGKTLSALEPNGLLDVRLRAAARTPSEEQIERVLREVYSLWLCGPAGGGGVRLSKRQRLSNIACLVPREQVPAHFSFVE